MESAELTLPVAMVILRPWDWILFFTHKHDRTPPEAPLTLPPPPHGLTTSPLPPPPSFPSLGLCLFLVFVFLVVFFFPLSTLHHGFLFVSQLSGAAHHGDSALGCL